MSPKFRLASLVLAVFASASAHAAVIDNFSNSDTISRTGVGFTNNTIAAAGAIGGSRFEQAEVTAGVGKASLNVNVNTPGALDVSLEANTDGRFIAAYPSIPNADLTADNAILVRVLSSDIGAAGNTVVVKTDNANISQATFTVPSLVGQFGGPIAPFDIIIPYASFTSVIGNANFANVTRIDFNLNPPANGDWSINYIATTTVPEPSIAGLAAVSGLLLARRRQR